MKSYSEMLLYPDWKSRLEYLMLFGSVGNATFGHDRWMNQIFYQSQEWKAIKRQVIIRDNACDLATPMFDIEGPIYVHHINPITKDMILERNRLIYDMDNLVTTSFATHNLIHYGSIDDVYVEPVIRRPNDTCPWKA